jgi:excisionase family DNA binding protein
MRSSTIDSVSTPPAQPAAPAPALAVSISQAASLLRCSPNHIRNLIKTKRLRYSRLAGSGEGSRGRILIQMSDLQALLAQTQEGGR